LGRQLKIKVCCPNPEWNQQIKKPACAGFYYD
jgi:hypothetical protein